MMQFPRRDKLPQAFDPSRRETGITNSQETKRQKNRGSIPLFKLVPGVVLEWNKICTWYATK